MITAQQAKEITQSQIKELGIDELCEKIEFMAKNGHSYWATDLSRHRVTEETIKQLENMGYDVKTNPSTLHFSINW